MNNNSAPTAAPDGAPEPGHRMAGKQSKAALFARVQQLKARIVVGSVVAFLGVSALAASHQVGSAASQATATNATTAQASADDGGFFNQNGSGDQQGYGLQPGNSYQAPVSGTSVS